MAQILKDNVRNQIIEAAISEIYLNGIKKISMRNIAKKADMTVGNLYRYYKSKDALINSIIQPVIIKIDQAIKDASGDKIAFLNVQDCTISIEDINEAIENLADELIKIYDENPIIMKIIMKNEIVSKRIVEWLAGLMISLSYHWHSGPQDNNYYYIMATSIIGGMSYAFTYIEDREALANNFKLYLKQIIKILGA